MRRALLWVALLLSGLSYLIVIGLCAPLLWAMRVDLRERGIADSELGKLADDPGTEVDL